jgi:hypothetical protein
MSAFALGTRRGGHGMNLFRFPDLMEKVKSSGVCLEVFFGQQADLYMLKQAIVNSYKYSALPDDSKDDYISRWRSRWNGMMNEIAKSDLVYCAAMFEKYYDDVKAEGSGHTKLYTLSSDDMKLWTDVYYRMVKDAGIIDG